MKKLLLSIVCLILLSITLSVACFAAVNIEVGDYIKLGTYEGQSIVWRCIDIDENGPLMISDKVLSFKAYDVAGSVQTGSHGFDTDTSYFRGMFGSDNWEDSNIRAWLNSTETQVTYPCGNAPTAENSWFSYNEYSNEAGFLSEGNFTADEVKLLKNVYHKSVLNNSEIENINSGKELFEIENAVSNYENAYGLRLSDKVFLPDAQNIETIIENFENASEVLVAYPTMTAYQNSEYKSSDMSLVKPASYWLSTSHNENFGDGVRTVDVNGNITVNYACTVGIGVRPAFYLNTDACVFASGDGTKSSPFVTGTDTKPYIYTSNIVKTTDNDVSLVLNFANFAQDNNVRIMTVCYNGGDITSMKTEEYNTFEALEMNISAGTESDKIKLFAWVGDKEIPLCSAAIINLN